MQVRVSRGTATEFEEAVFWYEQEEVGLGRRLTDAYEKMIHLLHRFPFSLITIEKTEL